MKFLIVWNVIVFAIFGVDKLLAKKHMYRIPEKILLFMSFAFGGAGTILSMVLFNHKTGKIKFRILVIISVCFYAILVVIQRIMKN